MSDTAQAIDLGEAASAFEGILAREEREDEGADESQAELPAQRQPAPAAESKAEPETPPEEPEGEGEAEETTESEETPEAAPEPLYTVKIDGKEERVTLKELQNGYSGQKWIAQKSTALGEERKAFDREKQAVSQERVQYSQLLTALQHQLKGEQEPDWEKLKNEDQFQYVVQREEWRAKQEKQMAINAELQRVGTLRQQEQQQSIQSQLAEGRQKLLEAIPAWKDPKKFETGKAEIREFAKTRGFTEDEIANTYDYRAVAVLHDALQWRKLVESKLTPVQNRGPRTMAPGSTAQTPGRPAELTRAKQRLAQSGRVEDAANIFEQILE